MNVQLLAHTPDPDLMVALAAKLCYSNSTIDDLLLGIDTDDVPRYIGKLVSLGHESPMEHAVFTFAIEDVSRALLAQITRHRIASFSVQSQRYVDMNNAEFTVPPAIARSNEEMLRAFSLFSKLSVQLYAMMKDTLSADYVKQGMSKKDAEKKAQEDARFVLPNACNTRMIVTMNARELRHFFAVRCCNRAQWEIRALADAMLQLVKGVSPALFEDAGPACLRGACSEGSMCCGHSRKGEL